MSGIEVVSRKADRRGNDLPLVDEQLADELLARAQAQGGQCRADLTPSWSGALCSAGCRTTPRTAGSAVTATPSSITSARATSST